MTVRLKLPIELSDDDYAELTDTLKRSSMTIQELAAELLSTRAASWRFKRKEDERRAGVKS